MRRLALIALSALAPLALVSCAPGGLLSTTPADVAGQTILDEKVAIGAELAYKAARIAVEVAVDSGRLTGAKAATAQALNRKAFAALGAVRTAYRGGNAASYSAAAAEAHSLVAQVLALI